MRIKWFGIFLYALIMIIFFYQLIVHKTNERLWIMPVFILLLFGIYDQSKKEFKKEKTVYLKDDIYAIFYLLIGFFLTIVLHYMLNVPQVMASALVGMLAYIVMQPFEKEAYCGSFAGMIAMIYLSVTSIAIMTILLPLVYLISKNIYSGIGGKLGAIAFIAGFFSISLSNDYKVFAPELLLGLPFYWIYIWTLLTIVIGWLLKNKFRLNSVFISAAISLVVSLSFNHLEIGKHLIPVVFTASFVIMSDIGKIKYLSMFTIAPIILAFLYVQTQNLYWGFGGKAGLIALITLLITISVEDTIGLLFQKNKQNI